jgi:hypothetical protein
LPNARQSSPARASFRQFAADRALTRATVTACSLHERRQLARDSSPERSRFPPSSPSLIYVRFRSARFSATSSARRGCDDDAPRERHGANSIRASFSSRCLLVDTGRW